MKWRWILLGIVVINVLSFWGRGGDGDLKLSFCDVGQGDAALIVWKNFEALIDTGANEEKLFKCIDKRMPKGDRKIEVVFVSHDQKDHSGALEALKKRYEVGRVVKNGSKGDLYRFGDIQFDILSGIEVEEQVLGAKTRSGTQENNDSLIVRLQYKDFDCLFTGDIDVSQELALVEEGVIKKTDILKVPHHGSKYGSSDLFLEKIKPKDAVVSVGANNSYGHPNGDTLMRLDIVGARVWRTDLQGTVDIASDGEKYWIHR